MDALINTLGQHGLAGVIAGISILANGYQYLQMQAMHRENRENDRGMLLQLFEALALIRTAVDVMKDRERGK